MLAHHPRRPLKPAPATSPVTAAEANACRSAVSKGRSNRAGGVVIAKVLFVLSLSIGGLALSIFVASIVLLAAVGFLFCDAPGATLLDCVLGGVRAAVMVPGRVLLPIAVGAFLVTAVSYPFVRR